MGSFNKILATFSDDSKLRGTQFEKLCKWILETDPIYKNKLQKVWIWNDWPSRWDIDAGIDLIAEDTEGKIWAIQAKCYDKDHSISKKDIDSFISESSNDQIHNRLLIATTDRVHRLAINVIRRAPDEKPIQQLLLTELLQKQLDWPESLEDVSSAGPKERFDPRQHQTKAIKDVIKGFKAHDRGQMIMACGTGKTLTGMWIAEELRAVSVLVLFPSLLLLSKTLNEWIRHSKSSFNYLPVCSDASVMNSSDDAIHFTTSDLSFPSTTSQSEIAAFLQRDGQKVVFSTYQSSPQIAAAYSSALIKPFDLIIFDEAHRCAGKAALEFLTALDNQKIPSSKRLFMTATPKIFKPHILRKATESSVDVSSMDDIDKFGPEFHKLSFGKAIENKLLSDYQVAVVGIDSETYSNMITKRSLVKTDTNIETDARSFASHIALAKAIGNYDLRRVITFHSRVKFASEFQRDIRDIIDWIPSENRPSGKFVTNYVSGAMSTGQRNQNLRRLGELNDGERAILANARCLSEGVDVPALDGVAFVDPRNSDIEIVQAVGRAIRLSSAKDIGTIIIPVFIKPHDNSDEMLHDSEFKKIWAVVNALRSHDEGLGFEMDNLRYELGKRGTVGSSSKIHFDLPVQISAAFEKALSIRLIESTTASWEFWYGSLERYREEFGDCLVDRGFKYNSTNLGQWVSQQRHKKSSLSSTQIARLDKLGFIWDVPSAQWEKKFAVLKAYKNQFGDCNPPRKFHYKETNLGYWVNHLRQTKNSLTTTQVVLLDKLGFIWDVPSAQWEEKFAALKAYKNEFGDCNPPRNFHYKETNLGNWINSLRQAKKSLTTKQIVLLDELGFSWSVYEVNWERNFAALTAYKAEFGDCLVPKRIIYNGTRLGSWVVTQRSNPDKLDSFKLARLNELGFIWDVPSAQWEEKFTALKAYKNEFGDCLVPQGYKINGLNLGSWVSDQRSRKKEQVGSRRTPLSKERIARLDQLGFVWKQK